MGLTVGVYAAQRENTTPVASGTMQLEMSSMEFGMLNMQQAQFLLVTLNLTCEMVVGTAAVEAATSCKSY